ncbi:MAG: DUF3644 domain-containing protein [Acidobacteria bacterium]|nr:DUF3644 domain-containing protein [Acidobacteriota bacterium]
MTKHKRRFGSVASELVKKAREAMLTAVQIFNNPQIEFKSELFIVTTAIAWTYLLHAYYRKKGIEYRRFREGLQRRSFLKTKHGAIWHWSLEECLEYSACPVDPIVAKNLKFLIGIRHEIEHQMTSRIDDRLSAKFQAAALNFNATIKRLFGPRYSLDSEQAFSIQFSAIAEDTAVELLVQPDLPQNIHSYIVQFENGLSQQEYDDPRFSYRVAFVRKTTNSKTAADKVVQFIPADSTAGAEANRVFLRETEKKKYRPSSIVKQMRAEGFTKFNMQHHTDLWKERDAKNPKHQLGAPVEGSWYWYEPWVEEVRKHCRLNEALYKPTLSTPKTVDFST